ncbi:hypothetical protein ACTXT7_002930 [Hymenolepis weldensis]
MVVAGVESAITKYVATEEVELNKALYKISKFKNLKDLKHPKIGLFEDFTDLHVRYCKSIESFSANICNGKYLTRPLNHIHYLLSHGALARELASIMTSISISSVSKPVDSTPTSTSNRKPTLPKPSVSSSSSSTEPIKESPERRKKKPSPPLVVVEDLAKSMPSLVQPYLQPRRQNCHNHHHRHHNHNRATQNRRLWLGRCAREHRSGGGDGEKVSSDSSSSATSLLEIAAFSTSITSEKAIPQILTESNTETTTHTLTVDDEFEPCHAYLSSSNGQNSILDKLRLDYIAWDEGQS